jgi:hypothetical protein
VGQVGACISTLVTTTATLAFMTLLLPPQMIIIIISSNESTAEFMFESLVSDGWDVPF